jgi:hypothetical protein
VEKTKPSSIKKTLKKHWVSIFQHFFGQIIVEKKSKFLKFKASPWI